jgi:hypothetical protein
MRADSRAAQRRELACMTVAEPAGGRSIDRLILQGRAGQYVTRIVKSVFLPNFIGAIRGRAGRSLCLR